MVSSSEGRPGYERLHTPQDWVDFVHEAFIPYCVDAQSPCGVGVRRSSLSLCYQSPVWASAVPDKEKENGGTVAYPDLLVPTPKIGELLPAPTPQGLCAEGIHTVWDKCFVSEIDPILRGVQSLVLHQYAGRPSELDTIVEGLSRSLGLVKELNHITILADSYDSKYTTIIRSN
jgi:hypothetical protein